MTTATSNARHGGIKSPSRRTRLIGNDKESDLMIQRLYVQRPTETSTKAPPPTTIEEWIRLYLIPARNGTLERDCHPLQALGGKPGVSNDRGRRCQ